MEHKDLFKDQQELDKRTQILILLLEDLIESSNQENKKMFLEGGFAVELESATIRGEDSLSRNHNDIDMHPMEEDMPYWKEWFAMRGFTFGDNEEIRDSDKAFVAYSPNYTEEAWEEKVPEAYYIDVYGVTVDSQGNISDSITGETFNWNKTWQGMIIPCRWKGIPVDIMRHHDVLERKRMWVKNHGTYLREKDLHDHKLFDVDID